MGYIGSKPADKALTGADIEDGTVQIADLAATGTKDATTFLRGDGTFASAGGDNTPYFYGQLASTTTFSRAVTSKVTGFTLNELDSDTAFDGTTFTVPSGKAGKYYIQFSLRCNWNAVGADGEGLVVYIYKNGSNVKQGEYVDVNANTRVATVHANAILDLSVSDTIECYVQAYDGSGGGSGDITNTHSSMLGYKIIE